MRISDWSSDVCSSDLRRGLALQAARRVLFGNPFEGCHAFRPGDWIDDRHRRAAADVGKTSTVIPELSLVLNFAAFMIADRVKRSAERRVGKGCVSKCRSRWLRFLSKKKLFIS